MEGPAEGGGEECGRGDFKQEKVFNVNQRDLFVKQGYNCAEAVMAGVAGSLDGTSAASGFGGGIGGSGATCGCVTGAIMGMGVALGVRKACPAVPYSEFRPLVVEFMEAFASEFGSTDCRELLRRGQERSGLDADDYRRTVQRKTLCAGFVDGAVRLAAGILRDRGEAEGLE